MSSQFFSPSDFGRSAPRFNVGSLRSPPPVPIVPLIEPQGSARARARGGHPYSQANWNEREAQWDHVLENCDNQLKDEQNESKKRVNALNYEIELIRRRWGEEVAQLQNTIDQYANQPIRSESDQQLLDSLYAEIKQRDDSTRSIREQNAQMTDELGKFYKALPTKTVMNILKLSTFTPTTISALNPVPKFQSLSTPPQQQYSSSSSSSTSSPSYTYSGPYRRPFGGPVSTGFDAYVSSPFDSV